MNLPLAMTREFVKEGKVTTKDLERIIAEAEEDNPKSLTEQQKKLNALKGRLLSRINN